MKFISYSPRICRKCKHIFRNRNKKTRRCYYCTSKLKIRICEENCKDCIAIILLSLKNLKN